MGIVSNNLYYNLGVFLVIFQTVSPALKMENKSKVMPAHIIYNFLALIGAIRNSFSDSPIVMLLV